MKKTYVKPQIYFEDFQLSANIAAGCGKPINHTMETCQPVPGFVLFVGETGCTTTPDDAGLCYQTVTDATKIFTS